MIGINDDKQVLGLLQFDKEILKLFKKFWKKCRKTLDTNMEEC